MSELVLNSPTQNTYPVCRTGNTECDPAVSTPFGDGLVEVARPQPRVLQGSRSYRQLSPASAAAQKVEEALPALHTAAAQRVVAL